MKRLILICILTAGISAVAQEPMSYPDMLASTKEIKLPDSLSFDFTAEEITSLDSVTTRKWFPQLLSAGANKFKNKTYGLMGKISSGNNFDLLVLVEEKKRADSSGIVITYLVSMKKTGEYISSLKAAVSGTKKKTGYNISSWLYKDLKLVQDAKITVNDQQYDDLTYYRINNGGRFIIYTND